MRIFVENCVEMIYASYNENLHLGLFPFIFHTSHIIYDQQAGRQPTHSGTSGNNHSNIIPPVADGAHTLTRRNGVDFVSNKHVIICIIHSIPKPSLRCWHHLQHSAIQAVRLLARVVLRIASHRNGVLVWYAALCSGTSSFAKKKKIKKTSERKKKYSAYYQLVKWRNTYSTRCVHSQFAFTFEKYLNLKYKDDSYTFTHFHTCSHTITHNGVPK